MKPARLAVLGIAVLAGGAAALMMSGGDPPPAPRIVEAPPTMKTVEVLVAGVDIPMGQTLKAGDLRWLAWPADSAPNAVIKRTEFPNGLEETTGSIARSNFFGGEPPREADQGRRLGLHVGDPAGRHARGRNLDRHARRHLGRRLHPTE
jgi:pilus assembly protein CpaB